MADAALCAQIAMVHQENYGVYGVRKMHAALRCDGVEVGRDRVARRMRHLGLQGVRRGRFKRTTIADTAAARPADLVNRQFHAQRPNAFWVCDLTYIRTWTGRKVALLGRRRLTVPSVNMIPPRDAGVPGCCNG